MEIVSPYDDDATRRVLATLTAGTAESTRRSYNSAVRGWQVFSAHRGWNTTVERSPAGRNAYLLRVLLYLQHLVDAGRSASTIAKTTAALKHDAALTDPTAAEILRRSPELRQFLAGVTRIRRDASVRRARAFTVDELRRVHAALDTDAVSDIRNRALIALGIATALRASTLTQLTLADLVPGDNAAVLVLVRRSKTDQSGLGTTIAVLPGDDPFLDPVTALRTWVQVLREAIPADLEPASVPLFTHVRRGRVQLAAIATPSEVLTDLIRAVVVRAGVADAETALQFSSHSLRASFITLSAAAGVPEARIAAITGHKNLLVLRRYDRSAAQTVAQTDYLTNAATA